jgi:hypothetical protein
MRKYFAVVYSLSKRKFVVFNRNLLQLVIINLYGSVLLRRLLRLKLHPVMNQITQLMDLFLS